MQDPRNEELLAEARILRQHKSRLETRMQILEDHNKQLESQLHRLRELLLQVCSEQGWGGLCHSRAGAVAQRGSQGQRVVTTISQQLFSFQPPTESEGNGSAASSLASSPHQSEGSQAKEKEHNTPDTETAGELWAWAELLALLPCSCTLPSCRDAGSQVCVQSAFSYPSALLATADEVEAKTQEVSMCLEDIMEKLRSAFPSSRGT